MFAPYCVATVTRVLLPHDLTLTRPADGGVSLLTEFERYVSVAFTTNVSICRDTPSCGPTDHPPKGDEETVPRLCEETIAIKVPSLFPVAFRDYLR